MSLHEPATFLTDVLLAALAGWLAWLLRRRNPVENHAARWISRALALTALSALLGGGYHGFAANFSVGIDATWWRLTLVVICLMSAAMAMSLVHEVAPPRWHARLRLLILVKFLAFAAGSLLQPRFVVVMADYGSTMFAWLVATALLRRAWRGWMLGALALSAGAATVQLFRWAPAEWFNHNDLYHVIQALALVAFYRAGRRFRAEVR